MAFELGIACELSMSKPKDYAFGLLERTMHRHKKNLSDLGGTDAFAHSDTQGGMVRAVLSFANRKDAPIRFKDAREF